MLLFYLFLSIGVSFLCSLFEAVILTISPAHVAALAESGTASGKLLSKLKTNLDDSLAAILTLNTVSHTVGAAGVGAEVARLYGSDSVAIASAILTILILVLSEIVPKTIGATYSRTLGGFAAYGIRTFMILTYPFVIVFNRLSKLIGAGGHFASMTRDEVAYTAQLGSKEGIISNDEALIINNLLRLSKIKVKEVMTPRVVVFSLKENRTVDDVLQEHETLPYSRIPLRGEAVDDINGMVLRYDILRAQSNGQGSEPIGSLRQSLSAMPEGTQLAKAYNQFVSTGEHIAAIFDEHGHFEGVITFEDVIETILGIEITDELDVVVDMRQHAKQRWKKRQETLEQENSEQGQE